MWNDHGKVLFPPIGRAELSIAEKLGKFQGLDSAFSAAMRLHAARRLIRSRDAGRRSA